MSMALMPVKRLPGEVQESSSLGVFKNMQTRHWTQRSFPTERIL